MANTEPTVEDCQNFRNFGDCMAWAGFHLADFQNTALKHIIAGGFVPYVDFAIYGPHGDRIQRAMQLTGFTFGFDNTLQRREFRGPSRIEAWVQCYNVFACAMIMLDVVLLLSSTVTGTSLRNRSQTTVKTVGRWSTRRTHDSGESI